MRRPPRNRYTDQLMSDKLISVADGMKGTLEVSGHSVSKYFFNDDERNILTTASYHKFETSF